MSCREHHANEAVELQKWGFETKLTQTSKKHELKLPRFTIQAGVKLIKLCLTK